MRKSFLITFCLSSLIAFAEQKTIMVVSDMHVLDTVLFDLGNPSVLYGDHKMPEHSAELWDSAVARVVTARPDILLVPGDMTYNGEKLSHLYVAKGLSIIRAAGTQVYVIPGNHDVSDPAAYHFKDRTGLPAQNLSAQEFATLYADFGYGDAVVRLDNETDSLCYMAYPSNDLALIAVNTSQSNLQGHKSAGGITEGALHFIQACAERARKDGHTNIVLMTHHPVMAHYDGQLRMDASHVGNTTYGVTNQDSLHKVLTAAHIHAVFSGHAHVNSIARVSTENGTLHDIVTGSLSAYPCPMRTCTLDTETGELAITGSEIEHYQQEAYLRDTVLAKGAVNSLTEKIYPLFQQMQTKINENFFLKKLFGTAFNSVDKDGLKELVWTSMGTELHHALCAFSRGDEPDYFPGDSAYNAAMQSYDKMLSLFFGGMEVSKAMPLLQQYGIVPDLGISPESIFGSIYYNYVTIDDEELVTPDGSCTVLGDVNIKAPYLPTALPLVETTPSAYKRLEGNRVVIYIGDKKVNMNGQTE